MTYIPTRRSYPGALSGISDVATAVRDVVEDPCLFPVAKMVSHLNDLQQPSKPRAPPGPRVPGVGLCTAVRPLKVVTFIAEQPVLAAGSVVLALGALVGIGYMIGRSR